jgi:hypothetical protein
LVCAPLRSRRIRPAYAELLFEVEDVVADAQLPGDAAGIVDVFDAATLLVAAELLGAGFCPQAHGGAHDVVALFEEHGGGDGAVDSAGHADDNTGTGRGYGRILLTRIFGDGEL